MEMEMEAGIGMDMKPYCAAVAVQLIYTGMFVVSKAAFNQGMSTYVFIFYRQAAGSLLLLPMALLHRKTARPVSSRVLAKLFFCALIGFTSATVASAADSSMPAVTFFLAVLLRMEDVKPRSRSGAAKVAGVALCLAGVLAIAFFAGPSISPVNHDRAFASHPPGSRAAGNVPKRVWIEWTLLMVVANMCWALWIVLQAAVLKEYPDKMVVTVAQCLFSTAQCFVVAVVAERDFSKWKLRLDVGLLAVLYSGFMVTGVSYYLQTWCIEMSCSSFFLGETVHLGSIVGGILLVGSLYSMLWGKIKESRKEQEQTTTEVKESTSVGASAAPVEEL